MIFSLLQILGGFILSFGWIPQIAQIIKTKSVDDLNPKTFYIMTLGMLMMETYAISLLVSGVGLPFFITNTVSLLTNLIVIFLIFKYRKKED